MCLNGDYLGTVTLERRMQMQAQFRWENLSEFVNQRYACKYSRRKHAHEGEHSYTGSGQKHPRIGCTSRVCVERLSRINTCRMRRFNRFPLLLSRRIGVNTQKIFLMELRQTARVTKGDSKENPVFWINLQITARPRRIRLFRFKV